MSQRVLVMAVLLSPVFGCERQDVGPQEGSTLPASTQPLDGVLYARTTRKAHHGGVHLSGRGPTGCTGR